ncbi:hypothetical protein [Aliarcobacter butzleri]|uniref:hypothetical protein n=1 Tax=Aliarcobacter butzleri TaxID=28197 RepID=UPI00125FB025|nr:hypothetical protein [Aliarcobacter butzleri]MCT7644452.1 hypothetical protein [Aliarcobacter butzleri]
MRINKVEKVILEELYKSSKLKLSGYNIFKKLNISIIKFNENIFKLISKNFIIEEELLTYKLTDNGIKWILNKKNKSISNDLQWKDVPEEFKVNYKLEVNDFYVPNVKLYKF